MRADAASPSPARSIIISRACCARGPATPSRCSTARAARWRRGSCASGAPRRSWRRGPARPRGVRARAARGRAAGAADRGAARRAHGLPGPEDAASWASRASCRSSRSVRSRVPSPGGARAGRRSRVRRPGSAGGRTFRSWTRPRRWRRRSPRPSFPNGGWCCPRRRAAGRCARCCPIRPPTALLVGPEGGLRGRRERGRGGGRFRAGEPRSAHPARRDGGHCCGRAGRRGLRRAISPRGRA